MESEKRNYLHKHWWIFKVTITFGNHSELFGFGALCRSRDSTLQCKLKILKESSKTLASSSISWKTFEFSIFSYEKKGIKFKTFRGETEEHYWKTPCMWEYCIQLSCVLYVCCVWTFTAMAPPWPPFKRKQLIINISKIPTPT